MNRILKSSFIDLTVLTVATTPILLSIYWVIFHYDVKTHKIDIFIDPRIDQLLDLGIQYYSLLFIGWLILRDVLNLSVGKRIQKIEIIDRNTGNEANNFKKVLRNIPFLIFLPIELIMKLIDPKARFGDMIANTKLKEITKYNNM